MKRSVSNVRSDTKAKRLLVLILSAIVAIALGVTCALCINTGKRASVNSADDVSLTESVTTYTNSTKASFQTAVSNGSIRSGDYIDFAYTGGGQSVVLYKGTYWLEVYGAVGGNDNVAAGSASAGYSYGGYGGYTFGEYTVTAASVTVYIYCGGAGASAASGRGGGYNGGGNAGSTGGSGAGGGATHIAVGVDGALTALNSTQRNSVLLVAGGGGGGGYSCYRGGVGGGGNKNGTNGAGANGGTAGYGGTQTAAGSGGNAGSGSQGGHRSGDGAGGGGGWYGGGAPTGDGGAGGGSGHIGSGISNGGGTSGANSGAGKARITYLNSNTSKTASDLNNGNAPANSYIGFGYTGNVQSISLPIGTYRLEVYGGAGGNDAGSAYGGYGGYTYGIYNATAVTTLYVVCGGKGANNAAGSGGGYNGGGNPGTVGSSGAGGGATHISTINSTLTASNKSSALIIAGGAGGGGHSSYVGGDGGGGNNAGGNGSGANTGVAGYGGTASAAGSGGNSGSGPLGGSRASGTDGGAGGGGWFGGGAPTGDGAGGGGSGRIGAVSDGGGANGARNSSGYARITVINVSPVATTSGGATVNSASPVARGGSLTVSASSFAKDPDGGSVYFSNGASNRETCNNVRLYLNAACSTEASSYVTWNANTSSGTSISITNVLRYPRSGIDGQANGVLTLYARIRDSYGTTTTHGLSVVPFKIAVKANTTAALSAAELSCNNSNLPTTKIWVGTSSTTDQYAALSKNNIYNPTANRYTALVSEPLFMPGGTKTDDKVQITLKAADLIRNVETSYDTAYIVLNDTSRIVSTNTSRIFKIKEFDNNTNKATIYNNAGTQIANAFSQITIVGQKPSGNYQVFPVTIYVVENTVTGKNNMQLPSPYATAMALDIVFKVDNNRPTLRTDIVPVVSLNTLATTNPAIELNTYFKDADCDAITSATHTITDVRIPTSEYIQLDGYGNVVPTILDSGVSFNGVSYANTSPFNLVPAGKFPTAETLVNAMTTANDGDTLKGTGGQMVQSQGSENNIFKTGFEASYISNGPSDYAYLQYSFSGSSLTLTGLRATSPMYLNDRTGYDAIIAGSTEDVSPAGKTASSIASNAGHFYILIHVQDRSDIDDDGIWLPLGIIINNVAPTDMSTEHGQLGATTMPTAEGEIGESFYFTPMGNTVNRVTTGLGFGFEGTDKIENLKPLAADADNFMTSNMLGHNGLLNELLQLKLPQGYSTIVNYIQTSVTNNGTEGNYFTVSAFDVYIPASIIENTEDPANPVHGRLDIGDYTKATTSPDGSFDPDDYIVITGIKITITNWTHGRYLYATANVQDSAGDDVYVKIAIKGYNTTPNALANRTEPDETVTEPVANISYTENGKTYSTSYDASTSMFTYNIPVNTSIIITPYDILTDLNMTKAGVSYPTGGFTLNGLSGAISNGVFDVGGTAGEGDTEFKGIGTAANVKDDGAGGKIGTDYSGTAYRLELTRVLEQINQTRTFTSGVSMTNDFANAASASTGIDRLYFTRTGDALNNDPLLFDPYHTNDSSTYGSFVDAVIEESSYISTPVWGSKVKFSATSEFGIDFMVVKAIARTPSGVSPMITLTVHDRVGASATGSESGVKTIKIKINVINATPNLKDSANIVYKLSTSDVNADTTTKLELLADSILEDNEGDPVAFYVEGNNYSVIDGDGNTNDAVYTLLTVGKAYENNYVRITITAQKIIIEPLNSTQNITSGLKLIFYATDSRPGASPSTLEIRFQVVNSKPVLDKGESGIPDGSIGGTLNDVNLWTVNSFTESDMKMTRYFASGTQAAEYLKTTDTSKVSTLTGAKDDQVRTLYTDSDRLQGVTLVPTYMADTNTRKWVNAPSYDRNNLPADKSVYKAYVPNIDVGDTSTSRAAVKADFVQAIPEEDGYRLNSVKTQYFNASSTNNKIDSYDIIYFVDLDGNGVVEKYTASSLTDDGSTVIADNLTKFFDEKGRWLINDWALAVKTKESFVGDTYFVFNVSARDETKFGGDTAGEATALNADATDMAAVDGLLMNSFYLFVKGTGIKTLDYYDRYDGYYTVIDGSDSNVAYVSTVDNEPASKYGEASKDTIYTHEETVGSETKYKIVTGTKLDNADNTIKECGYNTKDGTKAGTHSGTPYSSFDPTKLDKLNSVNEHAFQYSHTLEVSGDKDNSGKYIPTYLPMSYLALRNSLVSVNSATGVISYSTDQYISYKVDGKTYDRNLISDISSAITISDGTRDGIWKGDRLNANPYVTIGSFDYNDVASTGHSTYYTNSKYLNDCLAVTTVDADGYDVGYGYPIEGANNNWANYVGNGKMMYLANQLNTVTTASAAKGLQEHMFGLTITKKDRRASVSNLTIAINIALCAYTSDATGNGTKLNLPTDAPEDYIATIVLNIDIGNSPITLDNKSFEVGTDGYYVDMNFSSNGSAKSISLARKAANDADDVASTPANRMIYYSDEDYTDRAYFYSDSLNRFKAWTGEDMYESVMAVNAAKTQFTNTSVNTKAQNSISKYLAVEGPSNADMINVDDFMPNKGIFASTMSGVGALEGYSKFFSVNISNNSSTLTITPRAKTVLNSEAISDSNIDAYYSSRGLVAAVKDGDTVTKAYYPLRVLIYDSCGDGFSAASYVSLEIRVYIDDSKPELSDRLPLTPGSDPASGDRSIDISLAVGSYNTFSLADYISDVDLLSGGAAKGWYWESDYVALGKEVAALAPKVENGTATADEKEEYYDKLFKYETGNYLLTPFNGDWNITTNDDLIADSGKLYDTRAIVKDNEGNTIAEPDIIMSMNYVDIDGNAPTKANKLSETVTTYVERNATYPKDCTVTVKVNRRTTYADTTGVISKDDFKFTMSFSDNCGNSTGTLTINVNVINKAPYAAYHKTNTTPSKTYRPTESITMRVGDSFTVLTTPYNCFNGEYSSAEQSAQASNSYKKFLMNSSDTLVILNPNLMADPTDGNKHNGMIENYPFANLTYENLLTNEYRIRNYNEFTEAEQKKSLHLGYTAICDDDKPWTLRMRAPTFTSGLFTLSDMQDAIATENGNNKMAIDYVITASKACVNQPITIVVEDDKRTTYTHTIYVTVVSTPPRAITSEDGRALNTGLEYGEDNKHDFGSYYMYMKANDGSNVDVTTMDIYDARGEQQIGKNVYSKLKIDVNKIAFDLDEDDNKAISLYSDDKVPLFKMNDQALTYNAESSMYETVDGKFAISVSENRSSFTIICNSFDLDANEDVLTFNVRDVGNDIYANVRPMEITIYTLYSAITNKYNTALTTKTGESGGRETYRIDGAGNVNVKAYDMYIGRGLDPETPEYEAVVGKASTYQFLKYAGVKTSVDQAAEMYIEDPDTVLRDVSGLRYDVRVYALIDKDDETGTFASQSLSDVNSYLEINKTNGYFRLLDNAAKLNSTFRQKYLIGGRTADGNSYNTYINRELLAYVNTYFEFSIGADGVSLEFRPVTSNLNDRILFYVEVGKDAGELTVKPINSKNTAGSLFYVNVNDSAPVANNDQTVMSFTARTVKVSGDASTVPAVDGVNAHTFDIFNLEDPMGSMFTDSDLDDIVTVNDFTTVEHYKRALGNNYNMCKAGDYSMQAIDIKVNPNNTITIKVNRRVDQLDEEGHYRGSVLVPIMITGHDSKGLEATVVINLTIVNSDVTIDIASLADRNMTNVMDSNSHTGYELTATDKDYEYTLNTYVSLESGETSGGVYYPGRYTYEVIRWLSDNDFTDTRSDTESYRLVTNEESPTRYLTAEGDLDIFDSDNPSIKLATLSAIHTTNSYHFMGFTLTVAPGMYLRGHTGFGYVRVIDRAGDESLLNSGVTIRVNVTIVNSRPEVIEGKENNEVLVMGSNTVDVDVDTIDVPINDFVRDINPTDAVDQAGKTRTYLRVIGYTLIMPDEIYSTLDVEDVENLIAVDISGEYSQSIAITPMMGFYGTQRVKVTIADGDYSVADTDFVEVSITVTVIFNFDDIPKLKDIKSTKSMPQVVNAETLIEPITNTLSRPRSSSQALNYAPARNAAANDGTTFNPGNDYVVTSLSVPKAYSQFVDVLQPDSENPDWRFVPLRPTTDGTSVSLQVEFMLKSDVGKHGAKKYTKTFQVAIDDNPRPELIDAFKKGYTFYSSGTVYPLNSEGVVFMSPTSMFTDNIGDVVKFVDAESEAPSLVTVEVVSPDTLSIKFHASGTANITVIVSDMTDDPVKFVIAVTNNDLPEPTFWQSIMISFETNKLMWIIIIASIALAILVLIIVIVALKHRKRKREELEAMLISEMEIEEQMMRLAAGPGSVPLSSFGYLPPASVGQHDPGMLLGSGSQQPDPNVLNLNPGQVSAPTTVDISTSATTIVPGVDSHGLPPDNDF